MWRAVAEEVWNYLDTKIPGSVRLRPGIKKTTGVLFALNCQETVTRVLVNFHAAGQVGSFRSLIFAEVVDSLLLATSKNYVLGV